MSTANVKAVITADDRASSTIAGVGGSFHKMAGAMAVGQIAANAVTKAFDGLVAVGKQSIGMAFDQVRSVENATFALKAYEKDATKVDKVLKDLVAYARSDMGVLFQRDEMFKAASNLRGFGESADTVVDRVKTLSKGVALGMTSFDELSQIIGRATQQGKVSAEIYDMLAQRGIILDSSFRGASKSSEQLYKELNRVLPDSLLAGRANTIDGVLIRLKSSLRDLGATFLGVDKETSKFIEGGLGDRFVKGLMRFREILADPKFKESIDKIAQNIIGMINTAAPSIEQMIAWFLTSLPNAINWLTITGIPFLKEAFNTLWPLIQTALTWLTSLLNYAKENEWVIWAAVAAFAALKTAMFLAGALEAFQAVMAGVRTAVTITNALVATPMVMPAIVVVAAIASLMAVKQAVQEVRQAIIDVNNAARAAENLAPEGQMRDLQRQASEARARGDTAAVTRYSNAIKSLAGNATGTDFWKGGLSMVGEQGPEVVAMPRGSKVIPNNSLNKLGGGGVSPINITVQAGAFMGSQQDARNFAIQIANALKDYAKMNGTTATNILGG